MSAPELLPVLPVLFDEIVLSAAPVFNPTRACHGLRLRAQATGTGTPMLGELAQALAPTLAHLDPMPVLLCAPEAQLDQNLAELRLPPNVVLEIEAAAAAHPETWSVLRKLAAHEVRLALRGRAPQPVPVGVLPLFQCAVIGHDEDRRFSGSNDDRERRRVPFYIADMRSVAEVQAAFGRGAAACVGWPVRDLTQVRAKGLHPSQAIVLELMHLLKNDAAAGEVEALLKRDTTLGFALLKLVNSPAFGATARINSFQQAVLMLGYEKLQRWLTVMLANGHRDPELAPLATYSIARGFLLDQLSTEVDETLRNDLFLTGAFSLLDRLTGMPLETLFEAAVVGAHTVEALVSGTGPMAPFFELAVLSEQPDMQRVKRRLDKLGLAPRAFNRAVLRAMIVANSIAAI